MKALVVTMHAGEAEFNRCIAAVRAQCGVTVEHVVISGLSNLEAHRRCYTTIQQRSADFDFAAKVDADMVLSSDNVLNAVGRWFLGEPEIDHAQLAVHDFYTDQAIMGMHIFSQRVRWQASDERLFVDPSPIIPGRRTAIWRPPIQVAWHSPDPAPMQTFRFGVHRGLKAFQPDRNRIRGSQARDQWRTLVATWAAFSRTAEFRRGLAVYGADLVWRRTLRSSDDGYRSPVVDAAFPVAIRDAIDLHNALSRRWSRTVRREVLRLVALGPAGAMRAVGAVLRQPSIDEGSWIDVDRVD